MLFKQLPLLLACVGLGAYAHPTEQILLSPAQDVLASLHLPHLQLSSLDHVDPRLLEHIASLPEPRTIRFETVDGHIETHEITEGWKAWLVYNGIRFEDVTDEQTTLAQQQSTALPDSLKFKAHDLQPVFKRISTSRMREFLTHFSGFRTRYYRSQEGKKSQQWLLAQIKDIISAKPHLNISVSEFGHAWPQSSIILHWPRSVNATGSDQIVLVSAHQDSTNLLPFLPAPGADDDGSGTTTVLETLRILVETDFVPHNASVELHWYSAEEGGMLGSQDIANSYLRAKTAVKAMLQLDMTAYVKPGTTERIGIIQDFVDPELTSFLATLAGEYNDIEPVKTKCGYACSDHTAWTKIGVRSAFAIESTFEDSDHSIHSTRDTMDVEGFSFEHMAQFVKLATAFIKELSS